MVYKRGKIWWFKFVWRGEVIRNSTKQTNKRVAEQIEAAHKTQLARGEVGIETPVVVPTLAEFIDGRFMPHIRTTKAGKPLTVAFYVRTTNNLKADKKLKSLRLDAITADHVDAFIKSRQGDGLEITTVNRDLATLRRLLNLAVEWEVIPAARKIKLLPGEKHRDYVLAPQDEALYLAQCSPLLYAVAVVILDTGIRPEECHRLKWTEYRDGAITVHKGKGTGSRRRIEVTERVASVLAPLNRSSEFVFPNAENKTGHIDAFSYRSDHEQAIIKSGVARFVPYSFRHTALTRWATAGMDPYTLQYLAGHKSIATTMKYIHLASKDAQNRLREIRERMARGGHSSGHSGESAA
jgi:integrase